LVGYNYHHWLTLAREGKAPPPIQLSSRKYGWQVGALLDWIDARAGKAAAA
jgi:hypothetical protein